MSERNVRGEELLEDGRLWDQADQPQVEDALQRLLRDAAQLRQLLKDAVEVLRLLGGRLRVVGDVVTEGGQDFVLEHLHLSRVCQANTF